MKLLNFNPFILVFEITSLVFAATTRKPVLSFFFKEKAVGSIFTIDPAVLFLHLTTVVQNKSTHSTPMTVALLYSHLGQIRVSH